jgi:hypothetical protein
LTSRPVEIETIETTEEWVKREALHFYNGGCFISVFDSPEERRRFDFFVAALEGPPPPPPEPPPPLTSPSLRSKTFTMLHELCSNEELKKARIPRLQKLLATKGLHAGQSTIRRALGRKQ